MWIDSHCHLEAEYFRTEDGVDERPSVLARARQEGVHQMIVIGSGRGMHEVQTAIDWANADQHLYAAIGVHPHDAGVVEIGEKHSVKQGMPDPANSLSEPSLVGEELWDTIAHLIKTDPRIVGIGETGLDLYYEHSPLPIQKRLFGRFLDLAKETKKPLCLHIREAHHEALTMVKEAGGLSGVVHCFTGTVEEARLWLELGFFLSFSGIVTFSKATNVQEACQFVPMDRILLETDCPYLAPVPMRGKRNEPAYLLYTAEFVSKLKGIPMEVLAAHTTKNARVLFKLPG